jgi:hypothetical protein
MTGHALDGRDNFVVGGEKPRIKAIGLSPASVFSLLAVHSQFSLHAPLMAVIIAAVSSIPFGSGKEIFMRFLKSSVAILTLGVIAVLLLAVSPLLALSWGTLVSWLEDVDQEIRTANPS